MSDPAPDPERDDPSEPAPEPSVRRTKAKAQAAKTPKAKGARPRRSGGTPAFEPRLDTAPPEGPDFLIPDAPPEPRDPRWIPPERRLKAAAVLAASILATLFLWASVTLPLSRALQPLQQPTLLVLAANGQPIARSGSYKEAPVDVRKLPAHVRFAFLSIEDRRFYNHPGVDFQGLVRALLIDLKARRYVQGGSTITQQLAKNSFLTNKRTPTRKLQELLIEIGRAHV